MKKTFDARLHEDRGKIELFETADGGARGIPWARFTRGDGPRLFVTSTVHGNEVTGIRALQKLYAELRSHPFRGAVTCAPVLNPGGCEANRREVPETMEDLNRHFPGRADGGFIERVAARIFAAIVADAPDCHVDLHADSSESVAYVILDRYLSPEAARLRPKVDALSACFDATRIYDWPLDQYRANRLDASLSGSVLNQGRLPSFTVELGTLRYPDEAKAGLACAGLLRVMGRLGMLPDSDQLPPPAPVTLRRATPLRAERGGFVRYLVRAGQHVAASERVCEVSDVFGDGAERLSTPVGGQVLSIPDRYWCSPGMGLLTMAVPDE
ncbi:MAG: succinylglutamate desuccinylase/aspartoacylase family protein [Candidatus Wallbacteria bacterium]|nr:succinylglutamate desuccinylase/aspartoacylase family protein [Candidatus Wallbacteria bacterium]